MFEPIIKETFYVYVAPDGVMQLATMAPDKVTCMAVAKMMHRAGLGKSPHSLMIEGFRIEEIKATITLP